MKKNLPRPPEPEFAAAVLTTCFNGKVNTCSQRNTDLGHGVSGRLQNCLLKAAVSANFHDKAGIPRSSK